MDKELQRKINKSLQRKGWVNRQDWYEVRYGWQSLWTMGYGKSLVVLWTDEYPDEYETFVREDRPTKID